MNRSEDRSECGCLWQRHPDYGDVIVEPCDEHREPKYVDAPPDVTMVSADANDEELLAAILGTKRH
ncbi:hypothetical protein LCGC14_2377820 [marine sediment metagenome]|uniref:Uncharacterized protein n=1 Tax=marine sediment metagenome TaxID=412755 RepID=A0A0F9C1T6_9ZZZZ